MFLRRLETLILAFLILLLPSQFGLHLWFPFSYVAGIRVDYLSPTLYLTDLLIMALLLLRLRHTPLHLRFYPSRTSGLVLLVLVANLLLSTHPANSFFRIVRILLYTSLFFYLRQSHARVLFCRLLPISLLYASLIAIFQFSRQSTLGGPLRLLGERTFTASTPGIALASLPSTGLFLRPYSTFSHPNSLAAFLLVGLLLAAPSKSKLFFMATPFSLIALTLAYSKAVFLALGLLLVIRLLPRTTPYLLILLPFVSFLGLAPIGQVSTSASERQTLISNSIVLITRHPLLGVGLNNFIPTSYQLYLEKSANFAPHQLQPVHHVPLLIATEIGLIPLIVLLYLLSPHLKAITRRILSRPQLHQSQALVVILTTSLFDHYWFSLPQNSLLLVFLLASLPNTLGYNSSEPWEISEQSQ